MQSALSWGRFSILIGEPDSSSSSVSHRYTIILLLANSWTTIQAVIAAWRGGSTLKPPVLTRTAANRAKTDQLSLCKLTTYTSNMQHSHIPYSPSHRLTKAYFTSPAGYYPPQLARPKLGTQQTLSNIVNNPFSTYRQSLKSKIRSGGIGQTRAKEIPRSLSRRTEIEFLILVAATTSPQIGSCGGLGMWAWHVRNQ